MATVQMGSLFPAELVKTMFSKVKGHSSLAKVAPAEPIAFTGTDVFVFGIDGNVSIVGESAAKPAGSASITSKQIRPVKVLYQARVSDEFVKASEEKQIEYLRAFADGFSKKIASSIDVMAMHGVNPATGSASALIGSNCFDSTITSTNTITLGHDSTTIDTNIEEAIGKVEGAEYGIDGIVLAPAARAAMAELKAGGERLYPDFAFGRVPENLGDATLDVNATVSAASSLDRVLVGNFEAFRWGYADNIQFEVIRYGNPDGGDYDLKRNNEVLLRSEAYIGWGILDASAFALVKAANG